MKKNIYAISLVLVIILLGCSQYIEPPKKFLESIIMVKYGMNNFPYGEIKVSEFYDKLKKKQLNNGKNPLIKGWTNYDNMYTLNTLVKEKELIIKFIHILGEKNGNGIYSRLEGTFDGKKLKGIEILQFVL